MPSAVARSQHAHPPPAHPLESLTAPHHRVLYHEEAEGARQEAAEQPAEERPQQQQQGEPK